MKNDLYTDLLALRGMTWDTERMARFYKTMSDGSAFMICEAPVTARECWSFSNGNWSLFALADGPTARSLGADSVSFV